MNAIELMMKLDKVPGDAEVMSDSGWECDPTNCSRMFYDEETNTVFLTQVDPPTGYTERYKEI